MKALLVALVLTLSLVNAHAYTYDGPIDPTDFFSWNCTPIQEGEYLTVFHCFNDGIEALNWVVPEDGKYKLVAYAYLINNDIYLFELQPNSYYMQTSPIKPVIKEELDI